MHIYIYAKKILEIIEIRLSSQEKNLAFLKNTAKSLFLMIKMAYLTN